MDARLSEKDGRWTVVVATVEVEANQPIAESLPHYSFNYRFLPSAESPPGVQRFDVIVDFSLGEERASHIAYGIVTALQRAAESGWLAGYRVVSGGEHLDVESEDGIALAEELSRVWPAPLGAAG
jgi:hypothetical protein